MDRKNDACTTRARAELPSDSKSRLLHALKVTSCTFGAAENSSRVFGLYFCDSIAKLIGKDVQSNSLQERGDYPGRIGVTKIGRNHQPGELTALFALAS
jgi:hypothetical protein